VEGDWVEEDFAALRLITADRGLNPRFPNQTSGSRQEQSPNGY
jgi:hypothetical protein